MPVSTSQFVLGVTGIAVGVITVCAIVMLLNKSSSKTTRKAKQSTCVGIKMVSDDPPIGLISNFLTKAECKHLIALAEPRMNRSTVVTNSPSQHPDRTSYTANLIKSEDAIVKEIERRASQWSGFPVENLEAMQVVRYAPSQFYNPHYDYFVPGAAGTTAALARGGQRTITMFVYLNNLDEFETGGGTRFPKVNNLTIRPVRGQAVIWNNTLPSGVEDDRTLHGGDPPKQSTKYGLNIWFRQKEFR